MIKYYNNPKTSAHHIKLSTESKVYIRRIRMHDFSVPHILTNTFI